MYISPTEGLITFSIYTGKINAAPVFVYRAYVEMAEKKIYERLLDSKMLIVRNGANKALKFPYKHVVMFPDELVGSPSVSQADLVQLHNYAVFDAFRPITSRGGERRIEDLKIFDGIRHRHPGQPRKTGGHPACDHSRARGNAFCLLPERHSCCLRGSYF